MEGKIINWGVISCAWIADIAVIPGILAADNARLYAISSKNKDRLNAYKDKFNPVKAYDSYEEIINDPNIDAVYIPLPNSLHCEWVFKAAEKKKHILCEKPLGINAKEAAAMHEVCRKNGVLLMEAFAYRHSPLTMKVKSLVDEGVIGKVKFIEAHFSFIMNDLNNVRLIKNLGGGATYDIGCYTINTIRYIAGSEPISVHAIGEIGKESGVDETSCIMMEFKDDLKAVSYCSFSCADRSEYKIIGEKGIIEVPVKYNEKGKVKIVIKKDNKEEELLIDCPDNYMLEVEQFGRCISQREKPLLTPEDSFHNASVIDEVLKQIFNN